MSAKLRHKFITICKAPYVNIKQVAQFYQVLTDTRHFCISNWEMTCRRATNVSTGVVMLMMLQKIKMLEASHYRRRRQISET